MENLFLWSADTAGWIDLLKTFLLGLIITVVVYQVYTRRNLPFKKRDDETLNSKKSGEALEIKQPSSPGQVLKYYTKEQLSAFNGVDGKPIYIALKGIVYDVSSKADFYGPNGGYHIFAGRDASRALAKMSFKSADLDSFELSDLSFMERETLDDWITKFEVYNSYPKMGRILRKMDMKLNDIKSCNGVNEAPLYIALKGTIYDVTLKGMDFYGPKGPYHQFAGRDASRALACMSFEDSLLDDPSVDTITDEQRKVLDDWVAKFEKYGVVGRVL